VPPSFELSILNLKEIDKIDNLDFFFTRPDEKILLAVFLFTACKELHVTVYFLAYEHVYSETAELHK
jgi:hypothetical protein